jgi:hypothetical protein
MLAMSNDRHHDGAGRRPRKGGGQEKLAIARRDLAGGIVHRRDLQDPRGQRPRPTEPAAFDRERLGLGTTAPEDALAERLMERWGAQGQEWYDEAVKQLTESMEEIKGSKELGEAKGHADEALNSGESLPQPKQPGDRVTAGAINGEGRLLIETTALGAAYLAGLSAGVYQSPHELSRQWRVDRSFEPRMSRDEAASRMADWERAVRQTIAH